VSHPTSHSLEGFHQRMVCEVRGAAAANAASAQPAHRRSGLRSRGFLVGAGIVAAVGVGAGVVFGVVPTTSPPPAFAIEAQSDGTVIVSLRSIAGVNGANAKLEALGIRARAVRGVAGCPPPTNTVYLPTQMDKMLVPWVPPIGSSRASAMTQRLRIRPSAIPVGDILLMEATEVSVGQPAAPDGMPTFGGGMYVVRGSAPSCLPALVYRAVRNAKGDVIGVEFVATGPARK